MKDEEYLFFSDSFEKKNIARSSHNKRTHTGKGGCTLPSDKLTKKELYAMNGECKTYRLNSPMKWAEFKAMPLEHQETYLKLLRQKYNVSDAQLAKMFGISQTTASAYFKKKGMNRSGSFSGKEEWDKEGFWRWANGLPKTEEQQSIAETTTSAAEPALALKIADLADVAPGEEDECCESAENDLAFVPELGICEPDAGIEALDSMIKEAEQEEEQENVSAPDPIYIITLKEKTLLERAVGMLEGLSYGAQHCIADGILDVVQMLDSVLNKHTPVPEV